MGKHLTHIKKNDQLEYNCVKNKRHQNNDDGLFKMLIH